MANRDQWGNVLRAGWRSEVDVNVELHGASEVEGASEVRGASLLCRSSSLRASARGSALGTASRGRGMPSRGMVLEARGGRSRGGSRGRGRRVVEGLRPQGVGEVVKGRNFQKDEERQLAKSVLHVSQDPIVGNGQKSVCFWERIAEHYNERAPNGNRPSRSLETKWGQIKHDVSKFIGCYQQCVNLNKSGSCAADVLKHAEELYQVKSSKGTEFTYQHIWLMVKDVPRWGDGWTQTKIKTSSKKRTEPPSLGNYESSHSYIEHGGSGSDALHSFYTNRPHGTKHAKEEQKIAKTCEGGLHAQATATQSIAAATMQKAKMLEDANMLMLMTLPDTQVTAPEAIEYLRLRRVEELRKLQRRLAGEEEREKCRPISNAPVQAYPEHLRASQLASFGRVQVPQATPLSMDNNISDDEHVLDGDDEGDQDDDLQVYGKPSTNGWQEDNYGHEVEDITRDDNLDDQMMGENNQPWHESDSLGFDISSQKSPSTADDVCLGLNLNSRFNFSSR